MRDEKTKLKDNIQEQENAQLAEIKKMREMMNKKSAEISPPPADKFKSSSAIAKDTKIEESIGESQSLSQSRGQDKQTESYEDTFEDQSQS